MSASTSLRLQQEFMDCLEIQISELKSKAEDVTEDFISVVESDVIMNYNEARDIHKDLVTRYQSKPTAAIQKYVDDNNFGAMRSAYLELRTLLASKKPKSACRGNETLNSSIIAPPTQQFELRLPVLPLPLFYGDYNDWLDFNNEFTTYVHSSTTLEDLQKLQYLKQSVKGDANNVIKHLEISNENYSVARKLLMEKYHHPRRLANSYFRKLYEYEDIETETAENLKKFLDNINNCVVALQSLKCNANDFHLVYLMLKKLPIATITAWEESLGSSIELPQFNEFKQFLDKRYRVLEMTEIPFKQDKASSSKTLITKNSENSKPKNTKNKQKSSQKDNRTNKTKPCVLCPNKNHLLFNCFKFQGMSLQEKWNIVRANNQCSNCLGNNHTDSQCKSTFTCKVCRGRHHTLLHKFDTTKADSVTPMNPPPMITHLTLSEMQPSSNNLHTSTYSGNSKILGTAQVKLVNTESGRVCTARALIDPCSESSYIVDSIVDDLQLPRRKYSSKITAFGGVVAGEIDYLVNVTAQSIHTNFEMSVTAAVATVITGNIPPSSIPLGEFPLPRSLLLADPGFNIAGPIHLLLGVGPTAQIKERGILRMASALVAQKTKLGYVVEGEMNSSSQVTGSSSFMTQTMAKRLNEQIERFWRIEELTEPIPHNPDDILCEEIFQSSLNRRSDGRLAVDLPFRQNKEPILGASKSIATQRFLNLEKKLNLEQNKYLKAEYFKTIQDYIRSGHLLKCDSESSNHQGYFMPHHAVIKDTSTSTKVRVVYDGSCKTSNGTSLNSHLLTGPRLQNDIRDVLCNWRKYPIALTSDIEKMYRMFWINEKHRRYQKIIWRFSSTGPLEEYMLATITFGTSSAPYQAIRCLHYISDYGKEIYPLASESVKTDFYVDDCISGAYSISEAIQKQIELRKLFSSFGLTLKKWCSNTLSALKDIPTDHIEHSNQLNFDETDFKKTLGIFWSPVEDIFSFSSNVPQPSGSRYTKREVLSSIARLYDPLGWVSPCTMRAKIFMQNLWKSKIGWDDPISEEIHKDFCSFMLDLKHLSKIRIQRWINIQDPREKIAIVGFSDASLKGYGAVIYLIDQRATDSSKRLIMLSSRTKCCDLKYSSIARWELNGALLLANLFDWASNVFKNHSIERFAFTDSKIVLSWLQADPYRWKPYIANRTQKILKRVESNRWNYIESKLNPADYASRGLLPSEIVTSKLWWNGPELDDILGKPTELALNKDQIETINGEIKKCNLIFLNRNADIYAYINKCSDHNRLIREIEVHARFILNCTNRIISKSDNKEKINRFSEIQTNLMHPELIIFRLVQDAYFSPELDALKKGRFVDHDSIIKTRHPFIDAFGVMRVGGRLENADLPYSQRHPIVLPSKSQVTTNIIKQAHLNTDHGTQPLTEYYIKCKFFIPRLSDRVRFFIHNCVICRKFARYQHQQLMGSLPFDRVNSARAFQHSGVDYAGPILIKAYKGRCKIQLKAYVAVFVCLYSKCIHIEIVSDLSSDGFLAAFKRFVNRRGRCFKLFSDNGTNFKGANKILQSEIKKAELSWKCELEPSFKDQGTEWHFIPPSSPHFGGLWEASVKSIKTHLVKIVGTTMLTYKELNTLVIQIEGILNSRPLCPKSNNPEEFVALTPAHLLIGEPIVAPLEPYYDPERTPIKRWTYIQSIRQKFDTAWKRDYSHRLQQRPKWLKPGLPFCEGALVWVTDDRTPPTQWSLARIVQTHPGSDGITRAVTIIYPNKKTTRRSTAKLRLLPSDPPVPCNS